MKTLALAVVAVLLTFAAHGAEPTQPTYEFYRGSVDGKHEFFMILASTNDRCFGQYSYNKHKVSITLWGFCNGSDIELRENTGQVNTDKFVGVKRDDRIAGSWRSKDDKKIYPFSAHRITPQRKALLESAKGEYRLKSISGFYGANSMSEFFQTKGRWQASGSWLAGGQREGNDVDLSEQEQSLLSSFRLIVKETLAVSIVAQGKVIAAFPFSPQSVFDVKSPSEPERYTNRAYQYLGVENFFEGKLHIATTDQIDFSKYLPFSNTPTDPLHALSVDYDIVTDSFSINVFNLVCCSGTTLQFSKKAQQ